MSSRALDLNNLHAWECHTWHCKSWNIQHQHNGIWNLSMLCIHLIVFMHIFFIYPWVNLITLSALSACQDGAEILSWDEQIACNFPTFYLCVWMSACIFADSSVSPFLLLLAALLWPCLPARCSTWGLWALRGDSWHGSEYMCFWNDKLSNVSNVSAPVRLQSSPHI